MTTQPHTNDHVAEIEVAAGRNHQAARHCLYTVLYRGERTVGVYAVVLNHDKLESWGSCTVLAAPGEADDVLLVFAELGDTLPKRLRKLNASKLRKAGEDPLAVAVDAFSEIIVDLESEELTAEYAQEWPGADYENAAAAAAQIADARRAAV